MKITLITLIKIYLTFIKIPNLAGELKKPHRHDEEIKNLIEKENLIILVQ